MYLLLLGRGKEVEVLHYPAGAELSALNRDFVCVIAEYYFD